MMAKKHWYLLAIEIIDTQVARRGRQYHSQPSYRRQKVSMYLQKARKLVLTYKKQEG